MFTLFDANGYTLQAAKSLVDLLGDPRVTGHDLDLDAYLVLVQGDKGKIERNLTLRRAIADYVTQDDGAARIAAMQEQAARMAEAASKLDALLVVSAPAPEPEPEPAPEPQPEPAPEPEPEPIVEPAPEPEPTPEPLARGEAAASVALDGETQPIPRTRRTARTARATTV